MSELDSSGNHWQLFIDRHAVARETGLDRVVHHPRARGVVIPADRPWETAGTAPIHVGRYPDGTFFAHYNATWWDIDGAATLPGNFKEDRAHQIFVRQGYAVSTDGIHWQKPELGLVEAPAAVDQSRHAPYPAVAGSSRANNLGVPYVVLADLGQYGNVTDPARRYALRLAPEQQGKAAGVGANWQYAPRGYFAAELPDFRTDPHWRKQLLDSGGNFEPRRNLLHFWDNQHQEWVAIEQGVVGHWLPSREIARFASPDLLHWRSEAVLYPDSADSHLPHHYDEPMSLTPFCAEGITFGLLSWFHSDRTSREGGPNLEPSASHPFRWPYCRKGTNEMRITVSRDGGRTWDRTASRAAWIPHGTEEESYDRLVIGSLPPLRVGDEDWFYTNVVNGDHLITRNNPAQSPYSRNRVAQHQIALYTQKHNRYVSLSARRKREVLITRPVTVSGDTLELNVDASRGELRVALAAAEPVLTYGDTPSTAPHLLWSEIRDEHHLLPGFTFDDCTPVHANSVAQAVTFTGGVPLAQLRGRPVYLLFQMADVDLYGFRFTGRA